MKSKCVKKALCSIALSSLLIANGSVFALDYTVKAGDSLYTIAKSYNTTTSNLMTLNHLSSGMIYTGQTLKTSVDYFNYTVKAGDTLWLIAQRYGLSIDAVRLANHLTSDMLNVGQALKLEAREAYTVKSGDTLWIIANKYNISIPQLRTTNTLTSDNLWVGQTLLIPKTTVPAPTPTPAPAPAPVQTQLQPVATVFYIVQSGDTAESIAKKFGVSATNLIKYNYMSGTDWFNAGGKIAINGYAVRSYTVKPGESIAPAQIGKLVDWFKEGQYLMKRGDVFTLTDVATGASFKVKMLGGYNHVDIETLTAQDTKTMYNLFQQTWQWTPRAVVIFKDGMNIAASLSGMPHSIDSIADNQMEGHCDLYLYNSKPHGGSVSTTYVSQHNAMVLKAAGK